MNTSGPIFINDAVAVARDAMSSVNNKLSEHYATVIEFLKFQPDLARLLRNRSLPIAVGSEEYIRHFANAFANGRVQRAPQPPATIPDPMVSIILRDYWIVPDRNLERVKHEHQLSMASENIIGTILEHYIASIAEQHGWVWCSGEMIASVDFIKRPENIRASWRMLQIKNRDNSENSSSSRVRSGTTIEKWFRTFSRQSRTNWDAFPDPELRLLLSEASFAEFASEYLKTILT